MSLSGSAVAGWAGGVAGAAVACGGAVSMPSSTSDSWGSTMSPDPSLRAMKTKLWYPGPAPRMLLSFCALDPPSDRHQAIDVTCHLLEHSVHGNDSVFTVVQRTQPLTSASNSVTDHFQQAEASGGQIGDDGVLLKDLVDALDNVIVRRI